MTRDSTTTHKFYSVKEAKPFVQEGGKTRLEAVMQDDWIGWIVRIDMPDGTVARMCAKRTALPRVYTKPSYIYTELMELRPTEIHFELTTPELTQVKAFQQERKNRVIQRLDEKGLKVSSYCKQLGVNLATFLNILQGERRKATVEAEICKTLGLDQDTTFPVSVAGFLGIEYQIPT